MRLHWTVIAPIVLTVIGALLLVLSLAQLVIASVSLTPVPSPLSLSTPPWVEGETSEYRIQNFSGEYLGNARYSFSKKAATWTIVYDCETARQEEHTVLEMKGEALLPTREEKRLITAQGNATILANYTVNEVEVTGTFWQLGQTAKDAKPQKTTMPIPDNSYDNDQLLMLLRAQPFSQGFQRTYTNVVPANATQWTSTITVLGQETIKTPLGIFETWKVEIDFGEIHHFAWYQAAEPHHMVKYANDDTMFLLESINR